MGEVSCLGGQLTSVYKRVVFQSGIVLNRTSWTNHLIHCDFFSPLMSKVVIERGKCGRENKNREIK